MIAIIASTNRKNSISRQVANRLSSDLTTRGSDNKIIDLRDLPHDFIESCLYENSGANENFNPVRELISQCDKLFFVIPEYNGSFPGILKVFVDGLKFPEGVKGKKAALIGISSGTQGSALAMSHFTDILNYLGCAVLPTRPRITAVETNFINGQFTDPFQNKLVEQQLDEFIQF